MQDSSTLPGEAQPAPRVPLSQPSLFRETVETILLAALVFVVVNTATGRFSLDGPSMQPTLHKGEYVLVNRLAYKLHPPQRGDVIVFRLSEGMRIKRIIGLPGETVEIRQGQVFINDQLLPEVYVKYPGTYSMPPRAIAPGEYFVLGDNRDNSSDSHNWGALPAGAIDGKAWLIYWPPQNWGFIQHYSYPTIDGPTG